MREGDAGINGAKGLYRYALRTYALMELAHSYCSSNAALCGEAEVDGMQIHIEIQYIYMHTYIFHRQCLLPGNTSG